MFIALLLCRLALALVFAVAAWAKLTDYPRWRQSLDQHGLGARFATLVAATVPLLEAAVALGLLISPTAWTAALAALALLATFTLVSLRTLATGRAARCNCFGRWGRLSPHLLLRNLLLALPAVAMVMSG